MPPVDYLKDLVRTIPDFPKPGIQFRDITTLIQDRWGFKQAIDRFVEHYRYTPIDVVVAIESRGFIIGGALAHHLNTGVAIVRKKGKLPFKTVKLEYALEYGTDCIEMHVDAIQPGQRCLVVDDLLATGGTCQASCQLIERMGGKIVGCAFIIELPELHGRQRLSQYDLHSLIEFDGE